MKDYQIILASASPRRKEILTQAGLSFEVLVSKKEERITQTNPEQMVMELSRQKAEDVMEQLETAGKVQGERDCLVIGADTVVAFGGEILGKPKHEEDAYRMLHLLQGKTHQVYTGVTLLTSKRSTTFFEKTDVTVYPMTDEEIRDYIATGEPMDKAGAYGIQGRFAVYVERIAGDYLNVVGLPVARLIHEASYLQDRLQNDLKDDLQKERAKTERKPDLRQIRLIATDIDGTLVKESSPEVDPEIPMLMHELTKKGILCCVASGRQYYSIRAMFAQVADEIVYIAENGAHIVYKGQDLSVTDMQAEDAAEIIRQLRSYGGDYDFVVSTPQGSLVESQSRAFISLIRDRYRNKMEVVTDVLAGNPRMIKIAIRHEGSIREIGEQELIPAWKDRVKVCMAGEEWVDFMDASVDKGNAIRLIQDYFQIGYEETMTFGDNENDIGLMEAAKMSFAVENARGPVKQAAKYSCPDYTQKGVCRVLKETLRQIEEARDSDTD